MASFNWGTVLLATVIAGLLGGLLGGLMSLGVESLFGRRLSDRVKSGMVLGGVIVGYSVIKVSRLTTDYGP